MFSYFQSHIGIILITMSFSMTMFILLQPLFKGIIKAAALVLFPRKSKAERRALARARARDELNRLSSDIADSHPSLAADVQSMASRL
jgi:hypothetical protein